MTSVTSHISISLDGFVAGPNQSTENPLGEGGEGLHEWGLSTESWRRQHGLEGGESGPDLLIALLVNPWLHPRPIPTATISTDTTGIVRGKLLFLQEGRWFVATRGGAVRIVEPDHVEWARI